jgi:cyclohexa-1,5-dienecarbonyl-CoA hydratase
MPTATELLRLDHEAILRMLDALEVASERLCVGPAPSTDTLDAIGEFLGTFADRCHHAKEEGLLFPALEARGIPRDGGPLGVMLLEHDAGRRHLAALRSAAAARRAGAPGAVEAWRAAAGDYAALLREHIEKENEVLFPMADELFAPAELEALAARFPEVEDGVGCWRACAARWPWPAGPDPRRGQGGFGTALRGNRRGAGERARLRAGPRRLRRTARQLLPETTMAHDAVLVPPVRLAVAEHGALLRLTLDAPPGNILDRRCLEALTSLLAAHARAPVVRGVLFETAGRHFSYGASVAEHRPAEAAAMLRAFHDLFRLLIELGVPTLAAVRGRCLGAGLELAVFCHFTFAAPDAELGQPEVRLGVIAPVASLVLPWRVGQARADDLCLTGRSVGAAEAHAMGLVRAVAEDPAAAALAFFREHLAPRSGVALRAAARAARDGLHRALAERLAAVERLYLDEVMATHDAVEGIEAFLAKRPAAWVHG